MLRRTGPGPGGNLKHARLEQTGDRCDQRWCARVGGVGKDEPETHSLPDLTRLLADRPDLWPRVREGLRLSWNRIAANWESHLRPDHLAPLEAALNGVSRPVRALDLGTGTGRAARLVAARFPGALVEGVDLAEEMVREAIAQGTEGRIGYLVADGSALPFAAGAFDLITAVNVFLFWDEVTRILTPDGALAIEYSLGEATPIYLPVEDVKRHLTRAGRYRFEDGSAGRGTWILARKES
jgi:SAM-dependent methyltransferase